ncbi:MAG: 30S ribosomal protein S6 [Candidatus Spechtbacterales bacterium]
MEEVKEQIKKHYILHFILKPEFNSADDLHNYRQTINEKIEALEGRIEASLCQEETRRLAYQIEKQQQGYLCESAFLIDPTRIKELANNLTGEPHIVRYMIEIKKPLKKNARLRAMRLRSIPVPGQTKPSEQAILDTGNMGREQEKRSKITLDELDKKLDEIIKNI